MTGKDIFKEQDFANLYNKIEELAVQKLDNVFKDENQELTEEEADKCELIAEYKYNAQFYLETASLYFNRLKEV